MTDWDARAREFRARAAIDRRQRRADAAAAQAQAIGVAYRNRAVTEGEARQALAAEHERALRAVAKD